MFSKTASRVNIFNIIAASRCLSPNMPFIERTEAETLVLQKWIRAGTTRKRMTQKELASHLGWTLSRVRGNLAALRSRKCTQKKRVTDTTVRQKYKEIQSTKAKSGDDTKITSVEVSAALCKGKSTRFKSMSRCNAVAAKDVALRDPAITKAGSKSPRS